MRFGICAPYDAVAQFQDISFDYLEENVQRFLMPEQPQEQFENHLQQARLLPVSIEAANSLLPAALKIVATPTQTVDYPRIERYMKTALQRAEQVGIRVLVFGSGDARACPPGYSREEATRQIGEHFARWCTWAKVYDVQLVLEPLRYEETNTLNTVAESGAFVSQLTNSGARLLADIYHMACNNENATDMLTWSMLLSHVHVAEKQERAAPGRYGENFQPYFTALKQGGYDSRISIECRWQNLEQEANRGIAVLREQWSTVV